MEAVTDLFNACRVDTPVDAIVKEKCVGEAFKSWLLQCPTRENTKRIPLSENFRKSQELNKRVNSDDCKSFPVSGRK